MVEERNTKQNYCRYWKMMNRCECEDEASLDKKGRSIFLENFCIYGTNL